MKALYSAATGMAAQQVNIDNTSNNLANVNTTGFKRGEATFQDLIYVNEIVPGAVAAQGQYVPTGLQIGSGTQVSGITKIFSEGNLVNTSNPLDIAIQGDGFLQILLPDGELRYTRDGSLRLNSVGNIVNANGFLLQPAITIPQTAISISIGADGTVSIVNAGATNTFVDSRPVNSRPLSK